MKTSRSIQLGVALFAVLFLANTSVQATEPAAENQLGKWEVSYAVVYSLADLPVYNANPKANSGFDPSVLFELIKVTIDPESWDEPNINFVPYPQNLSCVITQTEANHAQVAKLLKTIREKNAKRKN